jgi:glycosyltransferase involved in cell wall biosynthesis
VTGPLISCVVPVHNGEAYVAQAIDSILAQTYRRLEVLVVNDCSGDRSAEIAAGYGPPVRVVELKEHGGAGVARAAGVAAAGGELIAFLDHDDLWAPGKLELQLDHLRQPPGIDVSFCEIENFWERGLEGEQEQWTNAGRLRGTYLMQTVLARRSVLERVPLPSMGMHLQHATWALALRSAGIAVGVLPVVLVRRRRHGDNLTRTRMANHYDELFAMLKDRVSASRPH